DYVAIVSAEAPDPWVEHLDEYPCARGLVRADDLPDVSQEREDALLGRRDEELAAILAEVKPEEIEAVVDMRDDRLLPGKLETSLSQERCHDGLDLVLQELFGAPGDDEIVSIPD